MKPQVLICHAYKSRATENWYPWLAQELKARGYDAQALELPDPKHPHETEWVAALKKAHTAKELILVGHSLGCRAILAYINQHQVPVQQVLFAACPIYWEGIIETRPPLAAYVAGMQPLDFPKIKNLVERFDLFYDTSDPVVGPKDVEFLKEQFGDKATKHISEGKYGHFDELRVPEVPEILATIV